MSAACRRDSPATVHPRAKFTRGKTSVMKHVPQNFNQNLLKQSRNQATVKHVHQAYWHIAIKSMHMWNVRPDNGHHRTVFLHRLGVQDAYTAVREIVITMCGLGLANYLASAWI